MKEHILIIDDELNLRITLALIFRRRGYAVTTAARGAEAMEILDREAFDLVTLDLALPDIDGLDLLLQILENHPQQPVLVLTALVSIERAAEATRRGSRGYLLKPVDPEIVIQRAESLLSEQRSARLRRDISSTLAHLTLSLPPA